jgi:hypothetical protein
MGARASSPKSSVRRRATSSSSSPIPPTRAASASITKPVIPSQHFESRFRHLIRSQVSPSLDHIPDDLINLIAGYARCRTLLVVGGTCQAPALGDGSGSIPLGPCAEPLLFNPLLDSEWTPMSTLLSLPLYYYNGFQTPIYISDTYVWLLVPAKGLPPQLWCLPIQQYHIALAGHQLSRYQSWGVASSGITGEWSGADVTSTRVGDRSIHFMGSTRSGDSRHTALRLCDSQPCSQPELPKLERFPRALCGISHPDGDYLLALLDVPTPTNPDTTLFARFDLGRDLLSPLSASSITSDTLPVTRGRWSWLPPMGSSRRGHQMVACRDFVLVIGGVSHPGKEPISHIDQWCFKEQKWRVAPWAMPLRWVGEYCVIYDEGTGLYLFGGYANKKECSSLAWFLDVHDVTSTWTELPPMSNCGEGRYGMSCTWLP